MRKFIPALLALALTYVGAPAGANHLNGTHSITFEAPVPCMAACAYWVDDANTDLDGDGTDDVHFQACEAPFPEGSFDDVKVTAPSGANLLVFEIFPPLDWDSFVCENGDVDGDGRPYEELGSGAIAIGDACDGLIGPGDPTGTGCREKATVAVRPGKKYILRAYNWQDLPNLQGRYTFKAL